jgi:acetyltransferase-like isoleucine patch superfamily enzyme
VNDMELERAILASSLDGHPRVSHPRLELHRRSLSTLFRIGVHLLHLVSNLLGDDVVGRSVRKSLVKLAGARMDAESVIHGGCYLSNPANLRMGFHTMLNRNCYLDLSAPVEFGDYSGAGHGATFITTIHDIVPGMNVGRGMSAKPIVVGERAWIGANVTVMPGVTIGSDAIVAAASLVARDVPANTLVAGVPARVVRRDVRHWLSQLDGSESMSEVYGS